MIIWEWLFVIFCVAVLSLDSWLHRRQLKKEEAELEARLLKLQQSTEKRKGGETG